MHLLIKQKSPSLPRNLVLFTTKVNLLYLIYLTGPGMLSSASDKTKLFPKNFSKNYNLDDSGISSLSFSSRTNLKLYNIFVTQDGWKRDNESWFIKGIWSWMYFRGGSKELWDWTFLHTSWTLQYESCFQDSRKVSLVILVFKNVGESSTAKNYHPVTEKRHTYE